MHITAIPREDMNSVSTRVHYYYYLNNLPKGFTWEKHNSRFGDVLYVQKKADEKTIKISKKANRLGVPVVYDCDDNPCSKPGKNRITMLHLADAVTTDTVARGEQLIKATKIKKLYIIPECVDYWPFLRHAPIREKMQVLITFGNNANAVNSAKYMKYAPLECRHINAKKIEGAGKFIKWNYLSFVNEMCKADACILIHGDNKKSSLKLLVAMAIGMPTIISDTTGYHEVYEKIGLLSLVAHAPADVNPILKRIESIEARQWIREQYKKYDMSRHTPQYSASKLAEVFKNVYKARV